MDTQEKLKQLIKIKGPVIPSDVYSEIGMNLLMTSATMAEMVSNSILKVSSVKIGSSPLYYLPGQEEALQKFSKNLHEKARKAYDLIKEKRILKDSSLEPVVRVALREIKDFAVPLKVNYGDNSEIFWKWYLLPANEAQEIISKELNIKNFKKDKGEPKGEPKKESLSEQPKPKKEKPLTKKTEVIKEQPSEKQKHLFANSYDYFNKNNIVIISKELNKRKTEGDLIVDVPTPVGKITYFCRVKDKKTINDSDLASAFVQGQQEKLPVLFITSGKLTKKAKQMLNKEFKGINIKQI